MPIDYGWLATKISGSLGPSRIEYHRVAGKTVWRMKPPHKRKLTLDSPEANPCKQWKQADAIWVSQVEPWRQLWRNALKKPGMSGYDLWMKEALTLCSQQKYLPDVPSISGGWSTSKVIPGTTFPPAGKIIPPPPKPPLDYFDCEQCFAGSYQTFYARLKPFDSTCHFRNLTNWVTCSVAPGSCWYLGSLPPDQDYFNVGWSPVFATLTGHANGPESTITFQNLADGLCTGGHYDNVNTEASPPCPHGPHTDFSFEIYPVSY
ncbi:hypothetical protein ES705_35342 [subsurface metagenome]